MNQRKLAANQIKKPPAAMLAQLRQGSEILVTHGQGAIKYGAKVPATVTQVGRYIEFRLHNQQTKWSVAAEGYLLGTDGFFAYLESAAAPCGDCGETPDRFGRCGCDY